MKAIFFIVLLFPICVFGADSTLLFTDEESCSVKEVGYGVKSNPVQFKGKRWIIEKHSGCTVEINGSDFEKRFSICFLTGLHSFEPGYCHFRSYENDGKIKYIFEFNDTTKLSCQFTCLKL